MSAEVTRILFDKWERVWNEDRHDLIAECMADGYVRHDGAGSRQTPPEQFAAQLAVAKQYRPGTRVIVYDHDITEDRAWFRFALTWSDATSGKPSSRAGMQVWRIEQGKLAESWLTLLALGSAWPDEIWQERWTTKRQPSG